MTLPSGRAPREATNARRRGSSRTAAPTPRWPRETPATVTLTANTPREAARETSSSGGGASERPRTAPLLRGPGSSSPSARLAPPKPARRRDRGPAEPLLDLHLGDLLTLARKLERLVIGRRSGSQAPRAGPPRHPQAASSRATAPATGDSVGREASMTEAVKTAPNADGRRRSGSTSRTERARTSVSPVTRRPSPRAKTCSLAIPPEEPATVQHPPEVDRDAAWGLCAELARETEHPRPVHRRIAANRPSGRGPPRPTHLPGDDEPTVARAGVGGDQGPVIGRQELRDRANPRLLPRRGRLQADRDVGAGLRLQRGAAGPRTLVIYEAAGWRATSPAT